MKKIFALLIGVMPWNTVPVEKTTQVAYSPARLNTGTFSHVPHEIIKEKIMVYFVSLKRSPLLHARTFHALCKSNTYFSQFLKDPKINEILIKNMASYKNKKKKWIPICKDRLLFSAAFQLNTVGARLYIKTFGQPQRWNYEIPVLSTIIASPKSAKICRFSLASGANPNYVWWGASALQNAAALNNLKCVKILLKHGADPNYFNKDHHGGWMPDYPPYLPLRLALKHRSSPRIIKQLLLHGANPTLIDCSSESPLDLARRISNTATFQLLEQYAQHYQNQNEYDSSGIS